MSKIKRLKFLQWKLYYVLSGILLNRKKYIFALSCIMKDETNFCIKISQVNWFYTTYRYENLKLKKVTIC